VTVRGGQGPGTPERDGSDEGWVDPRWIEQVLLASPSVGIVRLVCIDGPAGSGKTTLATALAARLVPTFGEVPVVHGDEVYEGWPVVAGAADRVDAFARLADRLEGWLLDRWRRGYDGEHPRWDWHARQWSEATVAVPPVPVVILEGVGLASRTLRAHAVLSVWVDAAEDVRLSRVLARDGESLRAEMVAWQRDEAAWHLLDETAEGCDVRHRT